MPATKKGASKKGGAKKGGTKKGTTKKAGAVAAYSSYGYDYGYAGARAGAKAIPQPLYGVPIYNAIASGDPAAMRSIRAAAQKHIKEVQTALAKLDAKLKK